MHPSIAVLQCLASPLVVETKVRLDTTVRPNPQQVSFFLLEGVFRIAIVLIFIFVLLVISTACLYQDIVNLNNELFDV